MQRERIGTVFVNAGLISASQLTLALQENRMRPKEKLGQTLVRMNLATDEKVARALSMQLNFPYIDLNAIIVDPYAVQKVPPDVAMKHRMLPIYIEKSWKYKTQNEKYDNTKTEIEESIPYIKWF